ncbi:MAG TPA: KEOPS complex subunit Pcc1 [Thermoplasmata archaeon]|nr:KEOPS complex subunit Pcc1 [Thermoplasmata archaeon]
MRLERRYGSSELARRVVGAVAVDDPGSVSIHRDDDRVVFEVGGDDPASIRATLDDLIACLGAAERTAGIVKAPGR